MLNKLTKSSSEEEYNILYEKFSRTVPKIVQDYFNKNWHCNRNEWTKYGMSMHNFDSYTNNHVELTNARLKNEIKCYSTFKDFVSGFFRYYNRRNEFIKLTLHQNIYKRPLTSYADGSVEKFYEIHLTPTAFKKVLEQYERHEPMSFYEVHASRQSCWIKFHFTMIETTTVDCECMDFTSMKLPCRHIFAVRKHFGLNLCLLDLCDKRWTKQYDFEKQPVLNKIQSNTFPRVLPDPEIMITAPAARNCNSLSKRRKMLLVVTNSIAQLGSLIVKETFENRLKLLKLIEKLWRQNIEVPLDNLMNLLNNEANMLSNLETSKSEERSIIVPAAIKVRGRPRYFTKSTIKLRKSRKKIKKM